MEETTKYYSDMLRKEAQPQGTAQYSMPQVADMLRMARKEHFSATRSIRINNMTIDTGSTKLTITSSDAMGPRGESSDPKTQGKKDVDSYYKIFSVRKMQHELKIEGKV